MDALLDDCRGLIAFPREAASRLYRRAKRDQWAIDRDVDWSALSLERLAPSVKKAMASIYTQIHYGEMLALAQSADVLARLPGGWGRRLAATQVADEARHVEFFSRVLVQLGEPAEVCEPLRLLGGELANVGTLEESFLGTQVVLESFAHAVFLEGSRLSRLTLERSVRFPGGDAAAALLSAITRFVGRDEARHIAFGVLYLEDRTRGLSPARRDDLQCKAQRWCGMLREVVAELAKPLVAVGVEPQLLADRIARAQARHLRDIRLDPR